MTTREAFIKDILDNPADDTLRLIYADWLEENGEPERAEFIRVQIELARTPDPCWMLGVCIYGPDPPRAKVGKLVHFCGNTQWFLRHHLRTKELELLEAPHKGGTWTNRVVWADNLFQAAVISDDVTWTRGFVSRVRLTCAAWMEHGPALVRAHPIERVELLDKRPHHSDGNPFWFWLRWSPGAGLPDLPKELWDVIHAWKPDTFAWQSEQAAINALSAGCIAWARKE